MPRVNRDDASTTSASTRKRDAFLFLVLVSSRLTRGLCLRRTCKPAFRLRLNRLLLRFYFCLATRLFFIIRYSYLFACLPATEDSLAKDITLARLAELPGSFDSDDGDDSGESGDSEESGESEDAEESGETEETSEGSDSDIAKRSEIPEEGMIRISWAWFLKAR